MLKKKDILDLWVPATDVLTFAWAQVLCRAMTKLRHHRYLPQRARLGQLRQLLKKMMCAMWETLCCAPVHTTPAARSCMGHL